jgi:uncharacterized protein
MKKKYTIYLMLLVTSFFIYDCSTDTKEKPNVDKDTTVKASKYHHPDKNVFMWEVKSANSKVYLLGSIHFAKSDIYPLDPRIENAFNESSEFVSEIDMAKANLSFIAEKAMYTDGSTLKSHLPADIYSRLTKVLEKHGVTESVYGRLKPGFALMTLMGLELNAAGFKPEQGIDMYFAGRTKDEKKNVHELESLEFQLNLFNEGLDKYMNDFIDYTLDDINNVKKQTDIMFESWAVGDTKAIDSILNDAATKNNNMKAIMKMLVDDRNIGMTDKIESYLKSGKTYFVVAGAGHMTGENGIISLLNKKGIYKIKQL